MDPDAEMSDEELDRNMGAHGVTRVSLDINLPGDAEVRVTHRLYVLHQSCFSYFVLDWSN